MTSSGDTSSAQRRLYMHVGHAKTGTSYLQSVLWGSRRALANSGLHLPLKGQNDHFVLALALRGELDRSLDDPDAFAVADRFVAELREQSAPRALVTHEVLSAANADKAARWRQRVADELEQYELHIVLTVRDLRRQIPAEWQQRVKTRSTVTYEDFLHGVVERVPHGRQFWRVQDTPAVAERWRGDLPPERVHIVTVPPSGAAPTLLLERFCRVLGVDPARLDTDVARANESLGVAQAELMRRVNEALGDQLPQPRAGYNSVARNGLANKVLAAQPGERLELPGHLDEWCRGESQRIVDHIVATGYDVSGDLDDLLPAPRTEPAGLQRAGEDQVAAAAVGGIAALLTQRHEDQQKLQQLRQEHKTLKQELRAARRRQADTEQDGLSERGPLADRARAVRERLRRL